MTGIASEGRRITKQGSRWLRFALVEAEAVTTSIIYDERLGRFFLSQDCGEEGTAEGEGRYS